MAVNVNDIEQAMKAAAWEFTKRFAELPCEIKPTDLVGLDLWFEKEWNKQQEETK